MVGNDGEWLGIGGNGGEWLGTVGNVNASTAEPVLAWLVDNPGILLVRQTQLTYYVNFSIVLFVLDCLHLKKWDTLGFFTYIASITAIQKPTFLHLLSFIT